MNPDTQGTTKKVNFLKNIKSNITTPYGTNNLSYKKLNHKNTITQMILQS